MTGRIKNVILDKGFGFIIGEDNGEYFFHMSSLVNRTDWDECSTNRQVTFEPSYSPKGKRAENVMVL